MAKVFEEIDATMREWIARQPLFFVASAPLSSEGHVNLSPKGPIGSLRVLGPHVVAYLDVLGSGAETIAHVRENGRIVIMFCAFEGPPRIVRLHGRGTVVTAADPGFDELAAEFEQPPVTESRRAVIVVDVERISDSCGYGVPLMSFEGLRPHQEASSAKRLRVGGAEAFLAYQREKNAASIDGLPALDA